MTRKASKLNELRMPLRFARLRALDLSRQHRTVDCAGLQLAPADQTRTRPERRHRVISAPGYVMMARAPVPSIRQRAAIRDEDIEVVDPGHLRGSRQSCRRRGAAWQFTAGPARLRHDHVPADSQHAQRAIVSSTKCRCWRLP